MNSSREFSQINFRAIMADREVKAFLKEARDLIKAKEYKNALKEVKKVLNKDKSNYMGLVFCGLCLSELDQPDQALQVSNFPYRRVHND